MKKVKFIFIELNSLQIGFITHHQLKRGWASKKVCVRWINAFGVDYKVRQMNEKMPHAGWPQRLNNRKNWRKKILHLFVTPAWCLMDFVRCHYNRKQISFPSAFVYFAIIFMFMFITNEMMQFDHNTAHNLFVSKLNLFSFFSQSFGCTVWRMRK